MGDGAGGSLDLEEEFDGGGGDGEADEGVAGGGFFGVDEVVVFGGVLGDGLECAGELGGELGDGGVGGGGGLEAADGGEEGVEGGAEVVTLEGGGEGDGEGGGVEAGLGLGKARAGWIWELGEEGGEFALGEGGGALCGGGVHGWSGVMSGRKCEKNHSPDSGRKAVSQRLFAFLFCELHRPVGGWGSSFCRCIFCIRKWVVSERCSLHFPRVSSPDLRLVRGWVLAVQRMRR